MASPLLHMLDQLIQTPSWTEAQQFVEKHPDLLGDETDALLAQVAGTLKDADARQMVEEYSALLQRCREVGSPRAFAEKILTAEELAQAARQGLTPENFLAQLRTAEQMPPELREVLDELVADNIEIHTPEDLERALVARPDLRARLEQVSRGLEVPPEFQNDLRQAVEAEQRHLRQVGERHDQRTRAQDDRRGDDRPRRAWQAAGLTRAALNYDC